MNYVYSDENLSKNEIQKVFIDREPYNILGERILDFSNCGSIQINEAEFNIITVQPNITVIELQNIIDKTIKPLKIIFEPGEYIFTKQLIINKSNIILDGVNKNNVVFRGKLKQTGDNFKNLIEIVGRRVRFDNIRYRINDTFIPIGSTVLYLEKSSFIKNLKKNDEIVITYEMNDEWIKTLGMDKITEYERENLVNWDCKTFVYNFERKIIDIDTNNYILTIDKEISTTLDEKYGYYYIRTFRDTRISNICIKNIQLETEFDETNFKYVKPLDSNNLEKEFFDEKHPMTAVSINWAKNVNMDNVNSIGFNEIVYLDRSSKNCTISNCSYFKPSSIIEGEKRYSFNINGQYNLCINCYAERGRHSFASASKNEGPLAFVNCKARITYAWSEPHHRYNLCGLYDNLDDNVAVENRLFFGTGHGWIGAYYVIWNPKKQVICQNTPIATNFVVGGQNRDNGNFYIKRAGYEFPSGRYVNYKGFLPFQSLYQEQLLNSNNTL